MIYDIQISHLNYYYNKHFKALDDISINVPQGSIYGFLGPNGAGKSTTMNLISGVLPDTTNSIKVFDKPIASQLPQLYRQMGCMIETPALYYDLSGADNMRVVGKANGLSEDRLKYFLELVGLGQRMHNKVKAYSMGMRQRLAIAMALYKEPKILLLDEPVNGLDPNGMAEIRNLLVKLNQELGITILISSHLLAEIEKMCTHVGIIHKGKMQYEGTIADLKAGFEKAPLIIRTDDASARIGVFEQLNYAVALINNQDIKVLISHTNEIPDIVTQLVAHQVPIFSAQQEGNLESWFLNITQ